jgi:hypothetical protein
MSKLSMQKVVAQRFKLSSRTAPSKIVRVACLAKKLVVMTTITACSMHATASGIPECGDDECTFQRDQVLSQVLLPLVEMGKLESPEAIKKLIISNKEVKESMRDGGEMVWRWPRREFSEVTLRKGAVLRIEIATTLVCIRRADVEKVFKEPWLIGQTPGQWFVKDRLSHPAKPHNGSMSFREGSNFRFVFGFQPSGCSNSFDIFAK